MRSLHGLVEINYFGFNVAETKYVLSGYFRLLNHVTINSVQVVQFCSGSSSSGLRENFLEFTILSCTYFDNNSIKLTQVIDFSNRIVTTMHQIWRFLSISLRRESLSLSALSIITSIMYVNQSAVLRKLQIFHYLLHLVNSCHSKRFWCFKRTSSWTSVERLGSTDPLAYKNRFLLIFFNHLFVERIEFDYIRKGYTLFCSIHSREAPSYICFFKFRPVEFIFLFFSFPTREN